MKKERIKSSKGAISAFVMITMMFFLVTIIGVYMISSKRAQTQTESVGIIQDKYYKENEEQEAYEGKITSSTETIPIYTKEQLWSVGTGTAIEIDGKVYTFNNNATYELKNDIVINIDELQGSNLVNESGITKNNYEIYYYKDGDYYVPTTEGVGDLSINGNNFVYKNLSQDLGYVTNGLVLHYDGIRNTATGHDTAATVWKDLSGNGNDGILSAYHTFGENRVNCQKVVGAYSKSENIVFDTNPQNYTVEIVAEYNSNKDGWLWSLRKDESAALSIQMHNYYNINTNWTSYQCFALIGSDRQIDFSDKWNEKFARSIVSSSGVIKGFDNNQLVGKIDSDSALSISGLPLEFGGVTWNPSISLDGSIYSIRIYNRDLSTTEIQQNYQIDQARFGIE